MCEPNEKHEEHWESLESCREAVADGISSLGTDEQCTSEPDEDGQTQTMGNN